MNADCPWFSGFYWHSFLVPFPYSFPYFFIYLIALYLHQRHFARGEIIEIFVALVSYCPVDIVSSVFSVEESYNFKDVH